MQLGELGFAASAGTLSVFLFWMSYALRIHYINFQDNTYLVVDK